MKLELNDLGLLPDSYPKIFFRVEDHRGNRMADFTTRDEAMWHRSFIQKRDKPIFDYRVCRVNLCGKSYSEISNRIK